MDLIGLSCGDRGRAIRPTDIFYLLQILLYERFCSMKLKRLSQVAFDYLADMTRMSEKSRLIVAAVLVEDRQMAEVSREFDVTRQRVKELVGIIQKVYEAEGYSADAVVELTLAMPDNIASVLGRFLELWQASGDDQLRGDAIKQVEKAILNATKPLRPSDT